MKNRVPGVLLPLALCLALAPWIPSPAQAEKGLSYAGSATISMSILYQGALKAFEKRSGVSFGRVDTASGTGRGLELLVEGKVDLAGAARNLSDEEKGKGLVAYPIGHDAVAFWVHRNNPVKSLTREQLRRIYRGQVRNWKEVGGRDRPIMVFIEPPNSRKATMALVQEVIMGNTPYPPIHSVVEYPREGMIAVSGEESGLAAGSIGLSSTISAGMRERLRLLAVDGVVPTVPTLLQGDYLLKRPLLLVTKGPATGRAKEFIDFMLSPEGQEIVARSFVPARQ